MDDDMGADELSVPGQHRRPRGLLAGRGKAIDWETPPTRALDARPPFYRWFPDGRLNVCHNALDRHVEAGRASGRP